MRSAWIRETYEEIIAQASGIAILSQLDELREDDPELLLTTDDEGLRRII